MNSKPAMCQVWGKYLAFTEPHRTDPFISTVWLHLHSNPGGWGLLLAPFYRGGKWESQMLNTVPIPTHCGKQQRQC